MGIPLVTLIAPATVAGVAIGFGAQQVVGDLLAGFFLFAEHQFGYGDDIRFSQPGQTKGVAGTVEEMTLRVTKLRTIEGELVIIPNSLLGQVTNLSKDWSQAVLDLPIAVGEDLELTNTVLHEAAMTLATDAHWSPCCCASRSSPACSGWRSATTSCGSWFAPCRGASSKSSASCGSAVPQH